MTVLSGRELLHMHRMNLKCLGQGHLNEPVYTHDLVVCPRCGLMTLNQLTWINAHHRR